MCCEPAHILPAEMYVNNQGCDDVDCNSVSTHTKVELHIAENPLFEQHLQKKQQIRDHGGPPSPVAENLPWPVVPAAGIGVR